MIVHCKANCKSNKAGICTKVLVMITQDAECRGFELCGSKLVA